MITSPATIVGRANGRSMIALTRDFPANESRTRTQAMIVPKTAVVSTARVAVITASFRAAAAAGEETTSTNQEQAHAPRLRGADRPDPGPAVPGRLPDDGRDRQHDDDEQERRHETHLQGESRRGSLPAMRGRCREARRRPGDGASFQCSLRASSRSLA